MRCGSRIWELNASFTNVRQHILDYLFLLIPFKRAFSMEAVVHVAIFDLVGTVEEHGVRAILLAFGSPWD